MDRRLLPLALVVIAVALLFASLAVGWYYFRFDGILPATGGHGPVQFYGQYSFYPGVDYLTSAACTGDSNFCATFNPTGFTGVHPYSSPGAGFVVYSAIGQIYEAVLGLVLGAAALGLVGAYLLAGLYGGRSRRRRIAMACVGLAFALALTSVALVLVGTSPAVKKDYSTPPNTEGANFSGPAGSFWGSCSSPSCGSGGGITDSWGPSAGWFLGWGGTAAFAVALAMLIRPRRERPITTS